MVASMSNIQPCALADRRTTYGWLQRSHDGGRVGFCLQPPRPSTASTGRPLPDFVPAQESDLEATQRREAELERRAAALAKREVRSMLARSAPLAFANSLFWVSHFQCPYDFTRGLHATTVRLSERRG